MESSKAAVVAIDGPVGVGKSTVARRVAESMHFFHLDTGAMYRAVALRLMESPEAEREDAVGAGRLAKSLDIEFPGNGTVVVDGEDVSRQIRDEAVSRFVSVIADMMPVREALVEQQRRIGLRQPSVLEGRDIGTVVFPDAGLKIYLDASPDVRVERRCNQLEAMGRPVDREAVFQALVERDERDRMRSWGALRLARDARLIDTTHFSEEMVVELICAMVRETPLFENTVAASE